jgi:anti-sigma factor RsiW
MCDERERLIGYVYDECGDGERRQIEDHLESCDVCRREIAGLRHVREDLLAWDVPAHEPIWRPFVAAPARPSWRDVPAWALAVAASLVLLVGAAGGVVTDAVLTRGHADVLAAAQSGSSSLPGLVGASATPVTVADLNALEARVTANLRSELDDRVRTLAAHGGVQVRTTDNADDLRSQMKRLSDNQLSLSKAMNNDVSNVNRRLYRMENSFQQVAFQTPVSIR